MKTSKRWMWMLSLTLCVPAWANQPGDGRSEDQSAESAKDAPATESPIQRLAELRIDEYVVPARMINLPFPGRTKTLQDILELLDKWSKDDKVGGVLFDLGPAVLSLADVEELRGGLDRLKTSGKKVMAFLNSGTPQSYLLACSADEITIAPTGSLMIPGVGSLFPFMQGYYQMVGLEFEVITCGRYKYPGFINRREPDQFFKEEFGAILDGMFGDYKGMIASRRGMSEEDVASAVDIALFDANQALQRGLVDKVAYLDDYRDQLLRREKMKRQLDERSSLSKVNSIQDLVELMNEELKKAEEDRKDVGPRIAVLHARGPIVDFNLGASFSSQLICRDDFVKVVDELRKNKSIKAVVMRVDSPGGSGYASDVIWQQLRRLGDEKPLVVSMGSVAGSGGYYIACPAARIFAQPTTITGSIGVLGIFQSAWSLYNRMDYEMVPMNRGSRALLGAPHRTLSNEDRGFIQQYMDDFYAVFIDRVATTRKIPAAEVRKIAEGRIYTGRQALDLGLVDELGGLNDAIESARAMANIPTSAELKIVHYPRPGSLGDIFESVGMMGVDTILAAYQKDLVSIQPISFEEQVRIFSQSVKPLCWMAVPNLFDPRAISGWGGGIEHPAVLPPLGRSTYQPLGR